MTSGQMSKSWKFVAIFALAFAAAANAQTVLFDLGSDESFRGVSITGPDNNGHYWNSVWSGAFYPDVQDINGSPTTIDFGFSAATGTDSYNGPAGPTSIPPTAAEVAATDVDTVALGNLGGSLAGPFDYYVNSRFEIQGLDPSKTYNLTFFGSHKFEGDVTTIYTVYTDNTYTIPVASAFLNVRDANFPWLHNRDQVATLSNIAPQASNILYISFQGASGGLGYLNDMQIQAVPEPTSMLLFAGLSVLGLRRRR